MTYPKVITVWVVVSFDLSHILKYVLSFALALSSLTLEVVKFTSGSIISLGLPRI